MKPSKTDIPILRRSWRLLRNNELIHAARIAELKGTPLEGSSQFKDAVDAFETARKKRRKIANLRRQICDENSK